MTTTDAQRIQTLETQIAELLQTSNDARLRAAPADQRPVLQREMELEQRERQLAADRTATNVAVLSMYRQSVATEMGIEVAKFEGLNSLAEIDKHALKLMTETMADPTALRAFADTLDKVKTPAEAAAAAEAATPGAPGTDAAPAGVGAGATAAPVSGAPGAADPISEITKRYEGQGATSIAAWLGEARRLPQTEVALGGQAPAAPAPLPPAPAPVPVPAAAPATPVAPAPVTPAAPAAPVAPPVASVATPPVAPVPEPAPAGSS